MRTTTGRSRLGSPAVLTLAVALFAAALGALSAAEPTAAQAEPSPSPAPAASPSPAAAPTPAPTPQPGTMPAVLADSKPTDWAPLDPENTLYVELTAGRVVIALAPAFAPNHVANVKTLARQGYFDGTAVLRSQENYVVQWGDPHGDDEAQAKPFGKAQKSLAAEFDRAAKGLALTPLADGDVYAPEVGFAGGFPTARDAKSGRAWLTHCYAMVGAGRGNTSDSGSGAELYVVIGHSPRHLDRNVTLLGRVVKGMELLTTLPRGTGGLGFYEEESQYVPLRSVRVAADVPAAERTELEVLRTDTPTFAALVDSRRTRREDWFLNKSGKIELCNVPLPVRPAATPAAKPAASR
ncbi:MAG TPA: peptidylprolyl isomerase [Thermoanaerobaculia bacterium]|nr:peptidylprolyl isomerase [Thermoanaerobaculia bacterium]